MGLKSERKKHFLAWTLKLQEHEYEKFPALYTNNSIKEFHLTWHTSLLKKKNSAMPFVKTCNWFRIQLYINLLKYFS